MNTNTNAKILWAMLGLGAVAGVTLLARQPNSKVRAQLMDAGKQIKSWAAPILKEMMDAQSAALARLEVEFDVIEEKVQDVKDQAIEQYKSVQDKLPTALQI